MKLSGPRETVLCIRRSLCVWLAFGIAAGLWHTEDMSLPSHVSEPMPIRSRGSFQLVSVHNRDLDRRTVLALTGPAGNVGRVAQAFDEVARVHRLLSHPKIAPVIGRGDVDGRPWIEFDCDATLDTVDLIAAFSDAGVKIPYNFADAFIVGLREATDVAHQTIDPTTGGPICLGRVSHRSVLFAPDGRHWLMGFGFNFPVETDDASIDPTWTIFQAPELSFGGSPSPGGDYVALVLFSRSLVAFVDGSGTAFGRLLQGRFQPGDMALIDCMRWVEQKMLGELPDRRPSVAEAIEVAYRIRELAGVVIDPDGFQQLAASVLADRDVVADGAETSGPTLKVTRDHTAIVGPDGSRRPVGRALRRVLMAFIEHHQSGAAPLSAQDLLSAGWPGEQPIWEAGLNRVYVTVNRLRQLGLKDLIERFDDGYRLRSDAVVELID